METRHRRGILWARGLLYVLLVLVPLAWSAHSHAAGHDEFRRPCDLCALACHSPTVSLVGLFHPTPAPPTAFVETVAISLPDDNVFLVPFGRAPPAL